MQHSGQGLTALTAQHTQSRTNYDNDPGAGWRADALCAQTDPEAFYPEKGGSNRDAKKVCNGDPATGREPCPVKAQCLQSALDADERFGVFGGLSDGERRKLRRDSGQQPPRVRERVRREINHGTEGGYQAHRRQGEDACRACKDGKAAARYSREARGAV